VFSSLGYVLLELHHVTFLAIDPIAPEFFMGFPLCLTLAIQTRGGIPVMVWVIQEMLDCFAFCMGDVDVPMANRLF